MLEPPGHATFIAAAAHFAHYRVSHCRSSVTRHYRIDLPPLSAPMHSMPPRSIEFNAVAINTFRRRAQRLPPPRHGSRCRREVGITERSYLEIVGYDDFRHVSYRAGLPDT
jgi:hypothetical protein